MPIQRLRHRVTVRFSPPVYARLKTIARQTQRTVSDVVRHAVEDLPIHPRHRSDDQRDLARQLSRIGNNLNQQTRLLHQMNHRGDIPDSEALLTTLKAVYDTLRSMSRRVGRTAP